MTSLVTMVKTIPITRRRISKAGDRYAIHLPMQLNDIWRYLHDNNAVLNLVIEVVSLNPKKAEQVAQNA
jgi:hypothetical protein